MARINPGSPGVPVANHETFDAHMLFLSDSPEAFTTVETFAAPGSEAAGQFKYGEVVGLNNAGLLVKATAVGGAARPIGVLTADITVGNGVAGKTISVYRGGHFNIDRLVWPAAYNTDALKLAAFKGAPSPTQIVADINKYHRAT